MPIVLNGHVPLQCINSCHKKTFLIVSEQEKKMHLYNENTPTSKKIGCLNMHVEEDAPNNLETTTKALINPQLHMLIYVVYSSYATAHFLLAFLVLSSL